MRLTDLSVQIRSAIKWFLIVIFVIFILWLTWALISNISKALFKPRGEDISYGNLPTPLFTKTYFPLKSKEFKLETSLPETKENQKATVFKINLAAEISDDEQNKILKTFGLQTADKQDSGNTNTWRSIKGLATLIINSSINSVSYRFNYNKKRSIVSGKISISEEQILKRGEKFLKTLNLLPKDIEKDKVKIKYLSIKNGKKESTSKNSANSLEIFYYRKLNGVLSVGSPPIRILSTQNGARVLEFDYFYLPLDKVGSLYPILDPTTAWEKLKEGRAFVVKSSQYEVVKITDLSLSYWESKFYQPFLEPVWVFKFTGTKGSPKEGEAYLPAIDPSYLDEE